MNNTEEKWFRKNIIIIAIFFLFQLKGFSQDYHWQFDDNQVVSTIGYPTILEGTNLEFIPGKIGKAINLKKDASSFPYSNDVSLGITGSYSISFWVNPSYIKENVGEEYFVANKRDGIQQFQIFINGDSELEFYAYSGSNSIRVVCNKKLPINRWSHFSITVSNEINDRYITIYFNGSQVAKQPIYSTPNTASTKIVFGSKFQGGLVNRNFDGAIDGFRVNGGRVITFDEIQSLANKNQSPDYRWKFDDYVTQSNDFLARQRVKDYMGYRDGEVHGEIPRVVGKVGYSAAKFIENEQNYVTIDSVETPNSKTYSLSFWIKATNGYPSNTYTLLKKRDSKNQYQVNLMSNGKIRFHLWGNNHHYVDSTPTGSEWTNVIIMVNNLDKKIIVYKNGAFELESTFNFEPWYGKDELIIGDKDNLATSEILLDDIRIYNNKVLDTTTINEIFNSSELPEQVIAPLEHQNYYKTSYRLHDYGPNFIPGPVTFDGNNIPYIRKENYVQTLENGKWVRFYFDDAINQAIPNWNGEFDKSENYDTRIIFDDSDWAYTFISTRGDNQNNNDLVLYSKDKCRTWQALSKKIRWANSLWETRQVHGDLKLPPILLSSINANDSIVKDLDIFFFKKNSITDELEFEKQITMDSVHIGVNHSGAPSQIVTKDSTSFLIYSKRHEIGQVNNGNPTYVIEIDRNSLPTSGTVENNRTFIGYAGENNDPDGHNYGSLAMDGNGYLHIVLSGHHDQYLKYTKSTNPLSIGSFSSIAYFGGEFVGTNDNGHTYNSLVCDENNKLHCITRWSGNRYHFRIAYLTKSEGGPWSSIHDLVKPFESNYHNWYHKLSIDRLNNLYVNFQLSHQILTEKAFETYLTEYPEESFLGPFNDTKQYTNMRPKFPSILKLESAQNTWKLGTTPDFLNAISSNQNTSQTSLRAILETIKDSTTENTNEFTIYPNPSRSHINVVTHETPSDNCYATIYDLSGRKISSIKLKQVHSRVDTSKLSKGIYLLKLSGNNKGVKKIVIK